MALFKQNSGNQSVAEIIKLLQAGNITPKPKANPLERLLAPLQALGSAPDVFYQNVYGGKKDPFAYVKNLGKGLKTALTGERMDKPFKTTSDILERSGMITGQDTGSRAARGVLGAIGDIALDPTTYLSFGTSALPKAGATALVKEASEALARKAITGAEKAFIKKSLRSGAAESVEQLLKNKGLDTLIATFRTAIDDPLIRNADGFLDEKAINNIASSLKTQSISPSLSNNIRSSVEKSLQNGTIKDTVEGLYKLEGGRYADMARSLSEVTKNVSNTKNFTFGAGKFRTKPITNKAAVFAAETLTNPIGKAGELVGQGFKKLAPELHGKTAEAFSRVFDMSKLARAANIGGVHTAFKDLDQGLQGINRVNRAKLGDLITEFRKYTPEDKIRFTQYLDEGIPEGIDTINDSIAKNADKWKSLNLELSDELVARNALSSGKPLPALDWKDIKSTLKETIGSRSSVREIAQFTDEQIKKLQEAGIETPEQLANFVNDIDIGKTGQPFINPVSKEAPKTDIAQELYDKTAESLRKFPGDNGKMSGDILPKEEYIRSILKNTPLEVRKGVTAISDLLKERAKVPPNKQVENYILHDVLGLKKEFLKNDLTKQSFEELMSDKGVQRDIEKFGYVKAETYNALIAKNPKAKRGFNAIMQSPQSALEESALQRQFPTMAKGEAAGVVYNKDMGDVMLKSLGRTEKAVRLARFADGLPSLVDDTGRKLFYAKKEIDNYFPNGVPNSYREFNIKGVGSFYAPKEALKILENYTGQFITDEGADFFLKGFDTIMNKNVKPWLTARGLGFIAYNIRNAMGDLFNMHIAGFKDIRNIREGIRVIQFENLAKKEGLDAARKKFGNEIADYWEKATDMGVLKGSALQTVEEAAITDRGIRSVSDLLDKGKSIKDKVSGGWEYITSAGGFLPAREDSFRLAMFIDSYKQTKSWDKAAKSVSEALFDFGDLTPTERAGFKRIIPFYSYMRKNFEFQLTNLAKNPGKYTTINHLIQNIQKNAGQDISEEEWDAMPDWMKSSTAFPIKKKNGQLTTLTGFGLPIEAINSVVGKDFGDTMRLLTSQSNPISKYIVEKSTGFDTYANRPIAEQKYGGRYKNMPQVIKDLLQYKETTGYSKDGTPFQRMTVNPEIAHMLNAIPWTSTPLTMAKRVSEVPEDPTNIINLLSGMRIYTRDIEQEKEARAREQQQALYNFLLNQGYGTMYEGFTIPNELRGPLVDKYGPKQ